MAPITSSVGLGAAALPVLGLGKDSQEMGMPYLLDEGGDDVSIGRFSETRGSTAGRDALAFSHPSISQSFSLFVGPKSCRTELELVDFVRGV